MNNAEILFENELKGAETFASYNGELYTGIQGGYVVKIANDTFEPIVKFGEKCGKVFFQRKVHFLNNIIQSLCNLNQSLL